MSQVSFQRSWKLYKRVFRYIIPFWPVLLLGLLANMSYAGIDASLTFMLKPFLDKGFIEQDLDFIRWVPLVLLVGIIARGIVHAVGTYCMTWVARQVVTVFRQDVFKHYMRLPSRYYDRSTSGQMLSRMLYDVEQIAHVSADALAVFVQSVCLIIGLLVVMFVINWQLALLFLITTPFVALIVKYTNRRIRRVSHDVQASMGQVTQIAEEALENYQTVRIFGGEKNEVNKFKDATELSRRRDMKVALIKSVNVAAVQTIIAIGIAGIILTAIHLSSTIVVSAGGFVAMLAAMLQLIKPMKDLTTVISAIQRGLAGAESVFNLLDEWPEKDKGEQRLQRAKGHIEYRNVNFAYRDDGLRVLDNINIKVEPGKTVALVGRSGSGKTTAAHLLPRFYDVDSGNIYLDGVDIHTIKLENLRRQIAIVSQDVNLFNDTIFNNIAYGLEQVSENEVIEAAKAAYALDFIRQLPEGLQSKVGDKGVLLSGGQKQRIAIARAILKDAPVIILDEATSALDTESERYIQAALDAVMKNRTTLVIAHRLSTIEKADQIIVMDTGVIVEQGSHQNLLSLDGYYAKLYNMQFSKLSSSL